MNFLYDQYSGALFGAVLRIVKQKPVAEEILQDGFVKVWQKIEQYDNSRGRLYTWMVNIFRNLAIDKTRSKEYSQGSKTNPIEDFVYDFDRQNFDQIIVERIGVQNLLEEVPEDQKEIIDLIYFKGFSQSQVSKKYNIPLGTVKSRLRAGIAKLKKIVRVDH